MTLGLFRIFRKGDIPLMIAAAVLIAFGFAAIFSVELSRGGTYVFLQKQAIALVIGIAAYAFVSSVNYHTLRHYARGLYAIGVGMLVAVLIFGSTLNGVTGWFVVGGFAFQPVEFVKVALMMMLGFYFSERAKRRFGWRDLGASGVLVAIPVGLLMLQPDLGGAALLVGTWAVMVLFAGIRPSQVAVLLAGVLIVAASGWFLVFQQYQKDRILTFLDPSRDPLATGYNVTQAKIAIGSGGLWGRGLGDGSQSQLRFLPESQTDFVFAVIAEELGFLGVCLLFTAFIVLLWRIITISRMARETFGAYLCIGTFSVLFIEVIVHTGANVSLMPATGVALPLVSYGGSSLLLSLVFLGLVQSVAVRLRPGDRFIE
ncbi:MAG: FtsW/RodA/SpoVE family cell cycle protein [Patescibacteria group bacterium]